jgi:uncharacterized membrane protein YccC
MTPDSNQATPPAAAETNADAGARTHTEAARAFWQILTHFDSTKLSTHRAFRNAAGVVLPLMAGYALGMPRGGLVVASGALNVSYSDSSDPYSGRARRMLASSVICAIAVFAGAISGQHQSLAIVLATAWAFIAGMANALGGAAPDLGVISLVTLLIYAAQPLTPRQAAISGVLALAGGLLQTALSIALWPVRRYDPERRALASFYRELATRAAEPLMATSAPLASIHSEEAQQTLVGLERDPGPESMRYRALLNQAERIRLSLLVLSRLRARMERERYDYPAIEAVTRYLQLASRILQQISDLLLVSPPAGTAQNESEQLSELHQQISLLRKQNAETPSSFLAAVAKDALFQMDALAGQLRAALDLARNDVALEKFGISQPLARPTWREVGVSRLEMLRENLNLQSATFRHAVRLAVLVAMGDIIGRMVSWRRTYWLPMTIVLVLKPEFTATFTRGVLRIAGTVIGLLLATALFHVIHPIVALQVALIFLFVFFLRWLGPANYGIFAIVVSGLIVLLLAIAGVPPKDVIFARGINTVVGGTLAIIAYRLWPTWERTRISERIARMSDAYREYFHAMLRFDPADPTSAQELERSRRAARVARSNLEASVDRLSSEPGATREQMIRLNAILASSHRFIHAVMALDAIVLQTAVLSGSAPLKKFAAAAETTLALLSSALRAGRVMPRDFPDLREAHRLMVQARTGANESEARYDSISVEADRMTNSLNTLVEQVMQWMRSPEFAELRSMYAKAQPVPSENLPAT